MFLYLVGINLIIELEDKHDSTLYEFEREIVTCAAAAVTAYDSRQTLQDKNIA